MLTIVASLLLGSAVQRAAAQPGQSTSSSPPSGSPRGDTPVVIDEAQGIATATGRQTQVFSTILHPDPNDPEHATDPKTGRNFHWDSATNNWVNSQTGQITNFVGYLCPTSEPPAGSATATAPQGSSTPQTAGSPQGDTPIVIDEAQGIATATGRQTQVFSTILHPDPNDPEHATDPKTGRNFHWDSATNNWVNSQTGQITNFVGYLCPGPPEVPAPSVQSPTPPQTQQPPAVTNTLRPAPHSPVSVSGFTPTFHLRGFGGPSFINGNTSATSGFDGAVLFPLGNHILVGPTAGFQWINSSIANSIGSHQPGSTFINTSVGFKSGNFGAQIQIPFMFFRPTGVHIDIHAGATVANSTITQAEGFCGLGNATSPGGCNVTSTSTTHDTVIGPFLGGYISHSIFPHVGVFAGYDWIHLKDTSSGGSTTGSSGGSQTLFDLNQNEIKLGIEIRIPITTHPPVLVSPTSTSPR